MPISPPSCVPKLKEWAAPPLTSRSEGRLLDESAKVKVALRAVTVETPGD